MLQDTAQALHGFNNSPINTHDIQTGINTVKSGGTITVVPVQYP
jgi:hypothetical protein